MENTVEKQEQMQLLSKFFSECLRYWERQLKVDSDLDNSAYMFFARSFCRK